MGRPTEKEIRENLLADWPSVYSKTLDTTFVCMYYWKKNHKVKVLVDGVERGPGWLAAELPNLETIRLQGAAIRQEYKQKESNTTQ